jgi:hypothetical protein
MSSGLGRNQHRVGSWTRCVPNNEIVVIIIGTDDPVHEATLVWDEVGARLER